MPTVTVTTHHQLQVGASEGNAVFLEIGTMEDVDLVARIEIPCGSATFSQSFLCRDAQLAQIRIESDPFDAIDGSLSRMGTIGKSVHALVWESSNFYSLEANSTVVLRITGISPAGSGPAELQLKIWSDPDELTVVHDARVALSIASAPGPAIVDFNVSASSVMQNDEVTLTAYAVNAKTVVLYGNDARIAASEKSEPKTPGVVETLYRYSHKPQRTTQYRLEAMSDMVNGPVEPLSKRETTVQVDPRPHWYSWDLLANSLAGTEREHGWCPTQLFPAMDLSGRTATKRLYGIFVDKETDEASLWSSSSGLDGWRWESDVPAGMHESPGVIHNQVLWLVGGSSANPLAPATNRVWWYFLDQSTNEMVWKQADPLGTQRGTSAWPVGRKCHTCAAFDGKVWVLGGLSEQDQELDDVWTCSADPRTGDPTVAWRPSQELPSGRCLTVAAVTPAASEMRDIDRPRLWLFGGTTHPYNIDATFNQLLWTEDGKIWHELALPRMHGGAPLGAPLGATLLYGDNGYLHLAGVFRDAGGIHVGCYKLMGADLSETPWLDEPLGEFAWDFQTDLFLIGSVSFGGRWIFWPNYQDWTGKKHYRARVYNTP